MTRKQADRRPEIPPVARGIGPTRSDVADPAPAPGEAQDERDLILDSVPAFVWFKDRHNRVVRANRAAAATIGKIPAELAGVSTYQLYPDEAAQYYRDDLEVIASGRPKLGIVETMRTASGELRWLRTDKIPYRDASGAVAGVIVFAVDITELKDAEVALARSRDELEARVRERTAALAALIQNLQREIRERREVEERLALALWATELGLWDWDVASDRVVYDQRWADLLGVQLDATESRLDDWRARVHPDDLPFVMRLLSDHLQNRTPHYESEHRIRTRSGAYRWIASHGRVVQRAPDGRATRVTGTFQDITARKQVEEQMERQRAELAHVLRVQTIESMAAEIAHEINQPLGAIANFANGLAARLRQGAAPDAAMLDVAEQIGSQALRAGRVLQRVRDFTRKESPRQTACDLNTVIRAAAQLIESDARRHGVRLMLALEDGLPPVLIDAIQVEQVILNLLRNGLDAILESTAPSHVLTIDSGLDPSGHVAVSVADTGRGIPPHVVGRVFEPFFSTKRDGLGMGLAISRSIIEAHQGRFAAPRSSERGAVFRFTLPPFVGEPPA